MRDLDDNANFLFLSHDTKFFTLSLGSMSEELNVSKIFANWLFWSDEMLSQNSSKGSDKAAEAHNLWPHIARAKALPENIWPTVTVAYTFSRAAQRPLSSINMQWTLKDS